MRNRTLHEALLAFAEQAGERLAAETASGAEVPFEVIEEHPTAGRGPALYCYRPLTGAFIDERIGVLTGLETYAPAARALQALDGLEAYLRLRGEPRVPDEPRVRADTALRAFLSAVYDDSSGFSLSRERFDRSHRELEAALYQGRSVVTIVAPMLGIALESAEVALGDGLSLARGDALSDPPADALWGSAPEADRPSVLTVLTIESQRGAGAPVAAARARFRRLLTALRLFEAGGFALGPTAWARTDSGPWRVVALGGSGRPRGVWRLVADQEDELRAFASLMARRAPRGGELAWALTRFELGCERLAPFEALTDHLLALRALLEPEGPSSGRLAQRLAAICALPAGRAALAERVAHAVSLERAVIAGLAPAAPGVDALIDELGGHLRAVLRDALCGHLDSDLRTVADELLEFADEAVPVPA